MVGGMGRREGGTRWWGVWVGGREEQGGGGMGRREGGRKGRG